MSSLGPGRGPPAARTPQSPSTILPDTDLYSSPRVQALRDHTANRATSTRNFQTAPMTNSSHPNIGLSEYFNNARHSDVTIQINGGQEIKAHKLILANGSDYFKKMFEGNFSERDSGVIQLKEDDPQAIKGVVAYIYGLLYDGYVTHRTDRFMPAPSNVDWPAYSRYVISLHITADKYMMKDLQAHVIETFRNVLEQFYQLPGYPDHIYDMARDLLYKSELKPLVVLREELVKFIVREIKWLTKKEERKRKFKKMMQDVPDLAIDLVMAMAEERKESGTQQTSQGTQDR